jgi:hypothetical protein
MQPNVVKYVPRSKGDHKEAKLLRSVPAGHPADRHQHDDGGNFSDKLYSNQRIVNVFALLPFDDQGEAKFSYFAQIDDNSAFDPGKGNRKNYHPGPNSEIMN